MDAKTGANIKSGKFVVGDKEQSFPIYEGTIGPSVIDIGKFYAETGMFTYDPGFTSTGSCESKITYIDGDEGILLYRGYPDRAAGRARRLPRDLLPPALRRAADRRPEGRLRLSCHPPHHGARADEPVLQGLPARRASDGGDDRLRRRAVGVLSRLDRHLRSAPAHDRFDPHDRQDADLAAMAYKYSIGQPFIYPKNDLDYATNFLRMCFAVPCEEYKPNAVLARAMDRIFILHADHEQNASTSTVRLAGSSGANPVRLHRGRLRLPVGTGAWRRQRGGAQDAGRDRHAGAHPGIHQARQGQERQLPPDGLRPPRLQELRSARQDHAEDLPRGAERARHQGRSAARRRDGARAHRAARRIFHREEALSRTSTSIRASRSRRWASRPPCSPCCSRSRARSAGSRSGRK